MNGHASLSQGQVSEHGIKVRHGERLPWLGGSRRKRRRGTQEGDEAKDVRKVEENEERKVEEDQEARNSRSKWRQRTRGENGGKRKGRGREGGGMQRNTMDIQTTTELLDLK